MNVIKKSFIIKDYEFNNKQKIDVELGYETYGTLNEDKSNVILVAHYFSASSHAAMKYNDNDSIAGYWDTLIGPNKAIDTNKYFVISIDNLANVQAYNPNVITTGPLTINPKINKKWGMDFPVFTFRDIAKIQEQFLREQLGIKKIHTIIGASAGGFIALEWAVLFKSKVNRVVGVITNPINPSLTTFNVLQHAIRVIELDQNWDNGNYSYEKQPISGLSLAIQMMNTGAFSAKHYQNLYQRKHNDELAYQSIGNKFTFENDLAQAIASSISLIDASHWLYTCKATMLHDITFGYESKLDAYKRIEAKVLMISCEDDLLQPTFLNEEFVSDLKSLNKEAYLFKYRSDLGHMSGILETSKFEKEIESFIKG